MPIRIALAASVLLVAACEAEPAGDVAVTAEPVALFPDDPGRQRIGALRYTGGLVLTGEHERFGGWSAIELSEDGTRLLALSDSASWMTASLRFDDAGTLTGLGDVTLPPLLDADGAPLSGNAADAEGLALLGDGRYAVSFERQHRIDTYQIGTDWSVIETAVAEPHPAPPGADRLRNNAGIEALASSEAALWAGVEYPIIEGQPYTLWRFDRTAPGSTPEAYTLGLTPGYGLTALATDGEGGLYLVERFYSRDVGNRIRIGQLNRDALETGTSPLTPTLLAEVTPDMAVDNFEALAIHEEAGQTRLFLMSDDNFNDAQRTLLLSFVIEP